MKTIKSKVSVATFASVMSTALILLVYVNHIFNTLGTETIVQRAQSVAHISTHTISEWLDYQHKIIRSIPVNASMSSGKEALRQAHLAGGFKNVYFASSDGNIVFSQNVDLPENFDPRSRDWYRNAINAGHPTMSDSYSDIVNGEITATISTPVHLNNNELTGVLGADILLTELITDLSRIPVGEGSFIGILEGQHLLSHINSNLIGQELTAISSELTYNNIVSARDQNRPVNYTANHNQRLLYLQQIPDSNWTIFVDIDVDAEFAPVNSVLRNMIFFGLILTGFIVLISYGIVSKLLNKLDDINSALLDFIKGDGDLTQRLDDSSNDELGRVATSFNTFVSLLQEFMVGLDGVVEKLKDKATNVSHEAVNGQTALSAQQQEIESITAALEQMQVSIIQVSESTSQAASTLNDSVRLAKEGEKNILDGNNAMQTLSVEIAKAENKVDALNSYATNISNIVNDIEEIADQTNLLALNAAIEAARAGESGRGFAVVADEVRNLAKRTQESTSSIQQVINELQAMTTESAALMAGTVSYSEQSVAFSKLAVDSFHQLQNAIDDVNDMSIQIASATEEQSAVTDNITKNMAQIQQASHQIAQGASDNAKDANVLDYLATDVKRELEKYCY